MTDLDALIMQLTGVSYRDPDYHSGKFDEDARFRGQDRPTTALTMIGVLRMKQLKRAIQYIVDHNIPGDLAETGVWRGGAVILMRATLDASSNPSVCDRYVWAFDSFEGLPKPDPALYPSDAGDEHWRDRSLAVSIDEFHNNLARFGLAFDTYGIEPGTIKMPSGIRTLKGWFRDTVPHWVNKSLEFGTRPLSLLRLDGDMYESTWDVLNGMYDFVHPGGFVIIDDYGAVAGCHTAVENFRQQRGITDRTFVIDRCGIFWRKGTDDPGIEVDL